MTNRRKSLSCYSQLKTFEGAIKLVYFQNQELSTEDDLTASVTETDRMRELQDKVACLRAQVSPAW